ncbi:MAG: radical SAM protein [Candidatus Limivicinus sp.]
MDALDAFSGSYSAQLSQRALEKRLPLSGTFELLPYCNMRCSMCYIVHDRPADWKDSLHSVDFWDGLLDQAIAQGMLYGLITGGEPLLYPGFHELMERINKKPIHLALNTNGTLLDWETVQWLATVPPGRLNISLYGGSNETYTRLCRNPRGFDQVTRAFALLNDYHIPYQVHATLTPENYGDFDEIIRVCNEFRAPLQMAYYMFPPYRKDKGLIPNEARFTPEKAAEVALRVLQHKNPDPHQRRMQLEANCACFTEPELFSLYGKRTIACRGGYSSFWVDWRGQLSGCGVHAAEHIDLTKVPFADAWKQVVASTEATQLSEKCQYCQYRCICPVCAAAAFCETREVDGTPDYLCRFCEVYAGLLKEELERLRKDNA